MNCCVDFARRTYVKSPPYTVHDSRSGKLQKHREAYMLYIQNNEKPLSGDETQNATIKFVHACSWTRRTPLSAILCEDPLF
jgi:hypothetical protein